MTVPKSAGERRTRESARGVVFNDAGALLLLCCEDTAPVDPRNPDLLRYWVTPGGGVKPGETAEQALRELHEETGLLDVTVGPWIWTRELELVLPEKGRVLSHERYFLCRTRTLATTRRHMTVTEAKVIKDAGWWSMAELAATDEVLRPPGLIELLQRLGSDGPPAEPIAIRG
jgi:8-oxo-dGTP pyrophosphatase MutT (NUDIX family)